jgi:osmotically-inducible protein OsmY
VGVAWLVFKRRRETKQSGARAAQEAGTMRPQMDDKSAAAAAAAAAADYRPELEASSAPVEMGGYHDQRPPPVELEGGRYR